MREGDTCLLLLTLSAAGYKGVGKIPDSWESHQQQHKLNMINFRECLLQGWLDWILSHGQVCFCSPEMRISSHEGFGSWSTCHETAMEQMNEQMSYLMPQMLWSAVFQAYTRLCSSFHLFWLLFRSGSNPCTILLNVKTLFKHYRHFFCTCSPVPSNGGQNKILAQH